MSLVAPVVTTCSVDVIDITEAQKMFPPPRPPSPTSRARVQKAHLPERPDVLTPQDADKLMAMAPPAVVGKSASRPQGKSSLRKPAKSTARQSLTSASPALSPVLNNTAQSQTSAVPLSPRDSPSVLTPSAGTNSLTDPDADLISWVNANLPASCLPIEDLSTSMRSGKVPTRLVEQLSGVQSGITDEEFGAFDPEAPIKNIETHFSVFDYLNARKVPFVPLSFCQTHDRLSEVIVARNSLSDCSLNDLMRGNHDRIVSLVEAIRSHYT